MNIYDFDKTIYDGDSTVDFFFYSLKKHPSIITILPRIVVYAVKFYVFKSGTKTQMKEQFYRFIRHIDYENDVKDFWNKNISKIKGWYTEQQKDDDIIISASPEFLLEVPCKMLGIEHLMASKVNAKTGIYDGENCHGKEKVRRLYEKFPKTIKVDEFYSDSYSDTPLAELAEKSFIVKGNRLSDWKFK